MVFQNNVLSGAGGSGTAVYQIDQSIRFPRTNNTTGGGYMSRTFGSAGDRTSWTWSCWFKLGTLNNFAAGSGLYYQFFACDNAKMIQIEEVFILLLIQVYLVIFNFNFKVTVQYF